MYIYVRVCLQILCMYACLMLFIGENAAEERHDTIIAVYTFQVSILLSHQELLPEKSIAKKKQQKKTREKYG